MRVDEGGVCLYLPVTCIRTDQKLVLLQVSEKKMEPNLINFNCLLPV